MVFERIMFVYGALISRDELLAFLKDRDGSTDLAFETPDDKQEHELGLLESFEHEEFGVELYEYKCCSKLGEKFVVIGKEVNTVPSPHTILNTVVTIELYVPTHDFKVAVRTNIQKMFGDRELNTYVMLDDCTFCS
uniref:Uncharacterized protein n=1 Tax=viral metagenome TaxID=1070528 RepID=A0A6C0M014_9ZZZZ